jgi:hypothetical protein
MLFPFARARGLVSLLFLLQSSLLGRQRVLLRWRQLARNSPSLRSQIRHHKSPNIHKFSVCQTPVLMVTAVEVCNRFSTLPKPESQM